MTQPPIYFDYAASTPMRNEVVDYYSELLLGSQANPSSSHSFGRKAKVVLESSRKQIAKLMACQSAEIIFTSGGTEANNTAIVMALRDLKVKRIITSPLEHHAVLHAAELWSKAFGAEFSVLSVDAQGQIDLAELEHELQKEGPALVSLMHGNNEIGNLNDLQAIGDLAHKYNSYFHSDTVQTVGHFPLNLGDLPIDFASASAHKFYGPKAVGFLYLSQKLKVQALISGGAQQRGLRGGTENIFQIGAMAKALSLAYEHLAEERSHIEEIKSYFLAQLKAKIPAVYTNGLSGELGKSLYTVASISFPLKDDNGMLLFNLDLHGFALSGGSACSSGSVQSSHVIAALKPNHQDTVLRVSFGKDSKKEEIDLLINYLLSL
ncbi:MAG: cysteine desulfurase [Bacteroidetes bacterium]|nr:MAG: cysteine desulfurase [Bacteroidota bacterium]